MRQSRTSKERNQNAAAIRRIHQEIASLYAQAERLAEIALSLSSDVSSESGSDSDTEDLQSFDRNNYNSEEEPNPVIEAFKDKAHNPCKTTSPTGEVDSLGNKIFLGDRVKFLTKGKNKSTCGIVRGFTSTHRINCEDKNRRIVTRLPKNLTKWY